ncbi:hypothetical protein EGR_03508 [Echinococcus granulosus]|uniref:Uncharacterized protein n=1 Tax=Echinococcus granulosus TaxID=6210 RepID=W6V5R8_ECHGR|nr:hypothetical protein EGR_03508 [Echinococcus granulosus]EUB61694.1 hypothetical protein EGR_03508 [Echinococcus granulosus]
MFISSQVKRNFGDCIFLPRNHLPSSRGALSFVLPSEKAYLKNREIVSVSENRNFQTQYIQRKQIKFLLCANRKYHHCGLVESKCNLKTQKLLTDSVESVSFPKKIVTTTSKMKLTNSTSRLTRLSSSNSKVRIIDTLNDHQTLVNFQILFCKNNHKTTIFTQHIIFNRNRRSMEQIIQNILYHQQGKLWHATKRSILPVSKGIQGCRHWGLSRKENIILLLLTNQIFETWNCPSLVHSTKAIPYLTLCQISFIKAIYLQVIIPPCHA